MPVSIGTRTLPYSPQVMRLRRAVLKITAKPSVPSTLPLYKSRPLLTRSESTLPQLLIPLHFNSFISNTYRKPQGGGPIRKPKVWQLVTPRSPLLCPHTNMRNPIRVMRLLHNSRTPRVGVRTSHLTMHLPFPPRRALRASAPFVSHSIHEARDTVHGSPNVQQPPRVTSNESPVTVFLMVDFPSVLIANGHSTFRFEDGPSRP